MIRVPVNASGRYDILIGEGLLDSAGEQIRDCLPAGKAAVITDDIVEKLYAQRLEDSLRSAGFQPHRYAFANGEENKNLQTLSEILEYLGEIQLSKGDVIIALGGGVVGDTAGLAAGLYARGMPLVQIPTTLLAAVDSSVGGKTAVNLVSAKNMAGCFHQPSLTLCDTQILSDLPQDLTICGVAEIIKYGLLGDQHLFDSAVAGVLSRDWQGVVAACVRIKADYVQKDERDEGVRRLLNLGHTFGHAIEQCSSYTIPHGKAVALGMLIIARAAAHFGYAQRELVEQLTRTLAINDLPTCCPYTAQELLQAALMDKKRKGDTVSLIVPREVGRCEVMDVPVDDMETWLRHGLEEE